MKKIQLISATSSLRLLLAFSILILSTGLYASNMAIDTLQPKDILLANATTIKLPKGTELTLKLDEDISTKDAWVGRPIQMSVYGNVLVDGDVLIATDYYAEGIITEVNNPGIFGRPASITIEARSVKTVDGQRIALNGIEISPRGASRKAWSTVGIVLAVVGTVAGAPVSLALLGTGVFEKGKHVEISKSGTILFNAKVKEDVMIRG